MASSTRVEHRTSPSVTHSLPMTTEAKMIVATGSGHCQQLKDMVSKEDPTTMVVVLASINQTSTPPKLRFPVMDPRLLAVASSRSFQDLESLLNGEDRRASSSDGAIGSPVMQRASGDEEAFLRESLLDAVTVGGDTILHLVATHGDCDDFLKKAGLIHRKAKNLLFVQNNMGDTPLHCAAQAGNSQMVSLLIDLAKGQDNNASRVKALLETENKSKWTVLHEAVRTGNKDVVKLLMEKNPQLASLPKDGTSPLYLAILLEDEIIVKTLYELSGGVISYSGPNGQNALHAAVLRGKDLTKMLLGWNNILTIQQDDNGSTPLHLATSTSMLQQRDRRTICLLLLEANPDALYQPDSDGSFPIHVAGSVNASWAIRDFIENLSGCAGLRDARGRTFLHVAADKRNIITVLYACRNRPLSWIMNMQDNDGNTALHLAVQAGSLIAFCALLGNTHVHLNLTNKKGETPLDIACYSLPKETWYYNQNSETKIQRTLQCAGAKRGFVRQDYFEENNIIQARQNETCKLEMVKEGTQNLCIGAVLIATVTFGATFAIPGGYRADDHTNGGTPTLAGRYAFDAFTLANALSFTFSAMATISLMYSGSPLLQPRNRMMHLHMAYYLMSISVTSLVAAFAIGTYVMLAPIAHKTAVGVCLLSSLILVYQDMEWAAKHIVVLAPLCMRRGKVWTFRLSANSTMGTILLQHWPIIIIFCSTVRNYPVQKVEPSAQPPTPSF